MHTSSGSLRRAADVDGRRHLRSANTVSLVVPPTRRSTLGDRANNNNNNKSNCTELTNKSTHAVTRCHLRDWLPRNEVG